MRLGFVIDHSRCIGCHACSVACKEEHHVPLGVYRTWVKYVEKGSFPDVRRHFSVLRCNHCDHSPCTTICPTRALFRADNGIVDFDSSQCIGCKACMQACPYDALYIDPATQTAAKCNFCAHRVDQGLKPSCEVVCPEEAILSGDLDDPASRISRFVHRETVSVRKPEQGTHPKLFYKEADEHSLDPRAASRGSGYLFAQEQNGFGNDPFLNAVLGGGAAADTRGATGEMAFDPELAADAERRARTTYDVVHHRPWGGMVSAYIFTKSIASGTFLCAALAAWLGTSSKESSFFTVATVIALLFLGVTSVFLIADLKQPLRFLKILTRPQWKSWLAIGAFILVAYTGLLVACLGARLIGWEGLLGFLLPVTALGAVMASIYTGFLFSQAEGRDFWQDPALPLHLLIQAMLAGSAVSMIVGFPGSPLEVSEATFALLKTIFVVSLVLDLLIVICSQMWMRHGTEDAAAAAHWMTRGPAGVAYRLGVIGVGHAFPLALCVFGAGATGVAFGAGLTALAGLLLFEHLWILAGQSQPLS